MRNYEEDPYFLSFLLDFSLENYAPFSKFFLLCYYKPIEPR